MTTTKTMNDALMTVSQALREHHSWAIFTHKKADGDAIGSASALFEAGTASGHDVMWFSPDEKLPETYSFLPHFTEHTSASTFAFDDAGRLYVFLDCANETRSVEGFRAGLASVNIDHHEDNTLYARWNCVDGKASSTCEMLFRLFKHCGWEITKSIAEALYTGLFTDTGSFSFSNTSSLTHNVAAELIALGVEPGRMTDRITQNKTSAGLALWARAMSRVELRGCFAMTSLRLSDFAETGADSTETEGLPGMLMTIRGVKLAVVLTEGTGQTVRVSFRSREGSPVDAGSIARVIGGGGHERAAGATVEGTLEGAAARIKEILHSSLTHHECHNPD